MTCGRLCALFLFLFGSVAAQNDTTRSRYIREFPDHFFIWPLVKQRSANFEIQNGNTTEGRLIFKPNNSYSLGVGVYLFEMAAEFSIAVPLDEKSRSRYGSSDVRDLQATVQGKNWTLDGFVQRYSGFYLSNPEITTPVNSPFPLRPDVELLTAGVNGLYVFNRNRFSLRSAYNFSEHQLKSSGSFLLAGTFNTGQLNADSLLISPIYEDRLKSESNFQYLHYATLSFAPGYTYTFTWRNLFLNLSLSVGPAHHWITYRDNSGKDRYDIAINSFVDSRIAWGYNSDRWFAGISFINRARNVKFEDLQVSTNSNAFKMQVGWRFREFGILKKKWKDFLPLPKLHLNNDLK